MDRHFEVTGKYFLQGDYVKTSIGVGIVARDEKEINSTDDLLISEVLVLHKSSYKGNPSNKPVMISREALSRIPTFAYFREEK